MDVLKDCHYLILSTNDSKKAIEFSTCILYKEVELYPLFQHPYLSDIYQGEYIYPLDQNSYILHL